jgi:hypothetical protein
MDLDLQEIKKEKKTQNRKKIDLGRPARLGIDDLRAWAQTGKRGVGREHRAVAPQ